MLLSGGLKTGAIHIDQTIGGDDQFKNVMENVNGVNNGQENGTTGSENGYDHTQSGQNGDSSPTTPRTPQKSGLSEDFTARGEDYDLDYTLLVPVLKVNKDEHPDSVILDMRYSKPCHSYLAVRPDIDEKLMEWQDCFTSGPIAKNRGNSEQSEENAENMQNGTDLLENNVLITTKDEDDASVENLKNPSENGQNAKNSENPSNFNPNSNEKESEEVNDTEDSNNDLIYLSPALISEWFAHCLLQISQSPDLAKSYPAANNHSPNSNSSHNSNKFQNGQNNNNFSQDSLLGIPNILSCKKNPPGVTLILACGGTRIQYDLIPVISFQGWPKVADQFLNLPHCWTSRESVDEIAKGFHVIPPFPISGTVDPKQNNILGTRCAMREWRLCFARSEVSIKKAIPMTFMKSFYAYMAIMTKHLTRYRHLINPYALRCIFFFAADRLPSGYLQQEDKIAVNLLGLIDDVLQCVLSKSCPNYFLNNYNIFNRLKDEDLRIIVQVILMVRSEPIEVVHECVNRVRISRQQSSVERNRRTGRKTDVVGVDYTGTHQLSNERAIEHEPFSQNPNLGPRQEDDMVERVRRLIESNPGKSISVFLNPEDVTKAHFRVDDRFF
jgi:hypothetical protein